MNALKDAFALLINADPVVMVSLVCVVALCVVAECVKALTKNGGK